MTICYNCGANVPTLVTIGDRRICCPHCFFNPLGCRCQYSEYGVAETWHYDVWDEDELEDDNDYAHLPLFMEASL